ncbi:TPR domain-containing protein [Candidatus Methylomirabilis lanthanidiphila]|uniref:TPR domain-containing protein n=1 Tax=Candidatus Methylomirabilis lanthanidiphila TaxID=2211376 RepID=A0A564ZH29_9BACT|nr:TPR domain-containing protein [Candidatus Methylomirabilis lanthanidiphila]
MAQMSRRGTRERRVARWSMYTLVMSVLLAGYAWGAQPETARSSEADQAYRLGVRLQQEGRWTEATQAFRSALRLDPLRAGLYVRLKEAYSRGGTGDQVLAELRAHADQDGTDFISWNLLGVLYAKQGRWADALAALQRAVQIQPADVDAWTNLGWLSSELKQSERAREAFRRALALDPAYGRAHAGLAGLYAETESNYDKALEEYRLALSAEPDNSGYLYDMGWVYYRKGMTDEALERLTQASLLSPDDPAGRAKIGWVRLRQKENQAAIEEFERALRAKPDYAFARFGLARALQAEGNDDAAAIEYKRAWRETDNDLYLLYLIKLYLQRNLWMVLLTVVAAMGLTGAWLMRRRGLPQGSETASGK